MTGAQTALVKKPNPKKAESFMIDKFVPGITTFVKMDRGNFIQSLSNIVQRQRKEGWLRAFLIELNALCEQGKVKEDYIATEQGEECRQELLDSLDKDKPDKEKFDAMKKIFLKAASAPSTEWANPQPQQLLRICRTLNAEELIILGTAYRLYKTRPREEVEKSGRGADQWPGYIAGASQNLISAGVVDFYEDDLIQKKLIGDRDHSDRSGVRLAHQCRLTNLAIELCEYLQSDHLAVPAPGSLSLAVTVQSHL